jgi:transporter family protein
MWLLFAILSAVFAALVAIFGKIGLSKVDPIFATSIRSLVMFVLVFLTAVVGKKINFSSLDRGSLFYIILSGLAGALSWIFYFIALKYGDASKVSAIDRLSIVFVIILAGLFALEKFTLLKVAGALLITIGAVLISL